MSVLSLGSLIFFLFWFICVYFLVTQDIPLENKSLFFFFFNCALSVPPA